MEKGRLIPNVIRHIPLFFAFVGRFRFQNCLPLFLPYASLFFGNRPETRFRLLLQEELPLRRYSRPGRG